MNRFLSWLSCAAILAWGSLAIAVNNRTQLGGSGGGTTRVLAGPGINVSQSGQNYTVSSTASVSAVATSTSAAIGIAKNSVTVGTATGVNLTTAFTASQANGISTATVGIDFSSVTGRELSDTRYSELKATAATASDKSREIALATAAIKSQLANAEIAIASNSQIMGYEAGVFKGTATELNVTGSGVSSSFSAGRWTLTITGGSGGGAGGGAPRIFVNGVDTGQNASTFTFHTGNGLFAEVRAASTTLSIPVTAQMTLDSLNLTTRGTFNRVTVTSGNFSTAFVTGTFSLNGVIFRTPGPGILWVDANNNGFADLEVTNSSACVFPEGAPVQLSTGFVYVQDEGVNIGAPYVLNFTGAGVTATNNAGILAINIPGGGGSSSLPLTKGSTDYVQTSTSPQVNNWNENGGIRASTGVFTSSFVAKDEVTGQGLIQPESMDVRFSTPGAGYLLGRSSDPTVAGWSFYAPDCTNGNCTGDTTYTRNLTFKTTTYTGFSGPYFVGTTSMTTPFNFSTMSLYGLAMLDGVNSGSSTINASYWRKFIPQNFVAGSTPIITGLLEQSTGAVSQQRSYLMSYATAASHVSPDLLVWSSTMIYAVSGNTPSGGGQVQAQTDAFMNGVTNIIGAGDKVLWLRLARDGNNATSDPSDGNTAPVHVGVAYQEQK